MLYTHINTNNKMDKQKKALSREIDAIIVGCALGEACDEAELVRLAIDYATVFRCEYQLPATHMRSLETEAEQEVARRLEANVNKVVKHTLRRTTPGMTGLGLLAMQRFTNQPKPIARALVRTCKCSVTRRSPRCKLPARLCKYTSLATRVQRRTKSSPSPSRSPSPSPTNQSKTRKSHGGQRRRH
jgi:hypothetical protein